MNTPHIPDLPDNCDTLTAALAYADAGMYVLPVDPTVGDGKNPGSVVGRGWPSLSSRDHNQIVAWFAGTNYGIALHCGRSGAVTLDVDNPDNVPDEVAAAMYASGCPYQSSRPDQPGRGHYLFANTTGRRIGNGLGRLATPKKWGEIRGANGVIIAAPTPHPDGGEYRWETTGPLPALPDYIADALPESSQPDDTATDAEVEAFMAAHTEATRPEALGGLVIALNRKLDTQQSCHMSTLGVLTDAMAEAAAGYYDARTAARTLWEPYQRTATTGTSTGRILTPAQARHQYKGIVAWAVGQADTLKDKARQRITRKYPTPDITITDNDDDGAQPQPAGRLETLEQDFWTARPNHQLIYEAAIARMGSPWAVLACVVARLLCTVPPAATLPPIIGGPGSLNWFAALSAKSGGGKGTATAIARQLLPVDIIDRPIGSGEGMIEAYDRNRKPDDDRPPVSSVMFSVDEIDSLNAMKGRSGQTTMSVLRQGFSGEPLGFSYRGRQSETVAAHTYRMTVVASVQPARAGVLFDDAGGGTPQRFMWFPARDLRVTNRPPAWPVDRRGFPRVIPVMSDRDMAEAVGNIAIPDEVAQELRDNRAASMREDEDALDGHALFVREKFAFALAVMDARTEMNLEDWRLAGIASDVSAWCRDKARDGYRRGMEAESRERGHQKGIERDQSEVSSQAAFADHIGRLADLVVRYLKDDGPMTRGAINRSITSRDRPRLSAALAAAAEQGLIREEDGKWTLT